MSERFQSSGLSLFCVLLMTAASCSKHREPPPAAPQHEAPRTSPTFSKVVGTAPKASSDIPVIIVMEAKEPREWPGQEDTPAMDQVSLTFTPPLLFVRAGQPSEFRNSDDTLHNVHVTHEETREPQFNVAIPTGERYQFTFRREGFYHVGCDIHPAMAAEIFASTSPYVTTSDVDGSFTFDDVVPGAYSMIVYANGRRIERDVTAAAGATTKVMIGAN
jgi:plastocyanin